MEVFATHPTAWKAIETKRRPAGWALIERICNVSILLVRLRVKYLLLGLLCR